MVLASTRPPTDLGHDFSATPNIRLPEFLRSLVNALSAYSHNVVREMEAIK